MVAHMELPDVLGFVLDEALEVIRSKGYTVAEVLTTRPWKESKPIGMARVVRLSLTEDTKIQVVVAYQDYRKEV